MQLKEPSRSPFVKTDTMGQILGRDEALASPLHDGFFHLAEHIVREDPRVHQHLN